MTKWKGGGEHAKDVHDGGATTDAITISASRAHPFIQYRIARKIPTVATAIPVHPNKGNSSASNTSAINAVPGGTRKNRADTRDTSPRLIMASNNVIATMELHTTK